MEEFLSRPVTIGTLLAMMIGGIVGVLGLQGLIKLVDYLIRRSEAKAVRKEK